jgi:sodium/proline symporter
MWIGIGLALGTALNWILVARRLRRFSEAAGDAVTLPQYLSKRFATKCKTLQVACAVVFLFCFTVYVASAFVAGADVFGDLFPSLERSTAMLIFAVILIVYTFLGGYKAVCWTDFVQGTLMLIAVLAVPIIIACTKDLNAAALDITPVLDPADPDKFSFVRNAFAAPATEIASGLAWGLGYFGMPHILVRFMAIKKPSMVKKSAIVAISWVVLALGAVVFIAVFGRMLIGSELIMAQRQNMVFIDLARDLFPPAVAGFLLAAIIAASMSTADSQLLVASSSFTSDIYKPLIRKKASDKETLWVGRIVVLIIAVIAYFIASSEGQGAQAIMDLVSNAWAGFGSAFGSVVILSLFWRRFTYKGALAGVIVGALVDILWFIFLSASTGIYELIPGFIASMIAAIVVTLIDKKPSAAITNIFDRATAPTKD